MQKLKQDRIFHKREFEIWESKLSYKETITGKSDLEAIIPFEELSNYKSSHENSTILFAILSAFTYALALISFITDKGQDQEMWIFFTLLATVLLILFIIYRQKSWKIHLPDKNTYVFIYKNIPDKKTVNEFIENIFYARNKYLRETYMDLDKNLKYEDQYNKLKWLNKVDAITKQEFEEKYTELRTLFNYDKKSIGFERQ